VISFETCSLGPRSDGLKSFTPLLFPSFASLIPNRAVQSMAFSQVYLNHEMSLRLIVLMRDRKLLAEAFWVDDSPGSETTLQVLVLQKKSFPYHRLHQSTEVAWRFYLHSLDRMG
jgi:hypothetical protein